MYANARQYIKEYGLEEASQLLADEEDALTEELMAQRLAMNTTTHTPEQINVLDAAFARLDSMLTQQSHYMDSYLRGKVVLPLSATNVDKTALPTCCMCLTRMQLMDDPDNITEEMHKQVARWEKWLREIAAGKALLFDKDSGLNLSEGEATGKHKQHLFGQSKSGFDWGGFH